tara:strand:+ start:460 stop:639 length:180 start_codon:yes stop_codon:yes gene_type:complete
MRPYGIYRNENEEHFMRIYFADLSHDTVGLATEVCHLNAATKSQSACKKRRRVYSGASF